MPKFKNISPLGALDVPLLRTVVEAGQVFEVTDEQARVLLHQPGNYEPADRAAKTMAADLAAQQDSGEADSHGGHEEDAQAPASAAGTEGDRQ